MKYSKAFKAKMVQKMLGGRSANSVAQEAGVNQPTLSKWLRDARTLTDVSKRRSEQEPRKSVERRPEHWSAEEKLAAVEQARGLVVSSELIAVTSCAGRAFTKNSFASGSSRHSNL